MVLAGLPAQVSAQAAPTKTAAASTPAEDVIIQQGAALHDEGKYDEAIAKYQQVLAASPTNMTALYELAYSYVAKKDYPKSLEAATRGAEYKSDMLPMFYDLIAESYDAGGQPQKAIDVYNRGVQVVPDPAMLYYNMGITYLESLKKPDDARRALEKGAAADPLQPAIQVMLGQVFHTSGYETPAFLAFSKYLILEPGGPRSVQAIGLWRAVLRGGLAASSGSPGSGTPPDGTGRDGAMRRPPSGAPAASARAANSDVGDFSDIDAQFAIGQQRVIDAMDKGAGEIPTLLAQIDDVLGRLAARDPARDRNTFVGRHYLPYFAELKQKNFVEPFVYWSLQRAPVSGVREWLAANRGRVQAFLDWTKNYTWPTT